MMPLEETPESQPIEDEPDLSDDNVFIERRDRVYELIKDDDDAFKKCIAEIYVFICSMEQSVRHAVNHPMMSKLMGGKKVG